MLDMTFSLKGLKTIIFKTTNTSQHVEFFHSLIFVTQVPTRTGKTLKPGKMIRHFPVREKSGNFVSPEKWEP